MNTRYATHAQRLIEITLSAALGAGMTRLEHGLVALKGGTDAAQAD
jgi:hypothetical protein